MESSSYYIDCILKEHKITDFLASRGIFPEKEHGDRIIYRCPVHEGDNDPSFVVFTGEEYQNYYCFGCHDGITIINLLSSMDKISIKEAIRKLSVGLKIDKEDILSSIIKETENFLEKGKIPDIQKIERLFFGFNRRCYNYLSKTDFDPEEVEFFEKVYEKVDFLVMSHSLESLQSLYAFIVDEGMPYRMRKYAMKKEKDFLINRTAFKNVK